MLDLATLQKTLTTPGTPGLDTLDQRFQDIAALAEAGDYGQCAERTAALFQEDIYDIRLLGYFLYGVFAERGVPALVEIMTTLSALLGESWPAIGPVKKKEAHTQSGLLW